MPTSSLTCHIGSSLPSKWDQKVNPDRFLVCRFWLFTAEIGSAWLSSRHRAAQSESNVNSHSSHETRDSSTLVSLVAVLALMQAQLSIVNGLGMGFSYGC